LRQEIRKVVEELSHGNNGRPLDPPEPKLTGLIDQLWSLLGKWTVAYLEVHPRASARELTAEMVKLNIINLPIDFDDNAYAVDVKAVRLAGGAKAAYVVSANWAWTGTFFIVARSGPAKFRVFWDIKRVARKNYLLGNELGYWEYATPG